MAFEFKLPDIGEGVVEGEIVKWLVGPGDAVEIDQPLVEVMTDKATVVIPSPKAGKVAELRGEEGDVAAVGSVIVVLEVAGEASSSSAASPAPSAAESAPAAASPAAAPASVSRKLAAPATRRLARELGVDLDAVDGSGPAGRVMADDVRKQAEAPAASAAAAAPAPAAPARPSAGPAPAAAEGEDQAIPIRGIRRKIWDSMARSAFTAPHFTFVEECDVTELQSFRKRLNARIDEADARLTFLPFIIKATCVALEEMPELNGQVDDANQAFIRRARKNIGIAVAADQGLTVPVVRDADRRSLVDLAKEVKRLADSVRDGRIASADLGGSTFTVTSLGKEGGLFATPILNYPEVGILGVHRLQKRPVVGEGDRIEVRSFINLSLSCDHRLIDGHIAARFAYRVIELLQSPDELVLHMG